MPTRSSAVPGIVVGLQIQGNPFTILYNPIGLRRDCKTAKDCQEFERIATKSWEIHESYANHAKLSQNPCPIAIGRVSPRDPTQIQEMPAKYFAIPGIAVGW